MRMSHLKVGSSADIPLNITETDLTQLTATVIPPSGREEPCLLKRLRNGHVGECPELPLFAIPPSQLAEFVGGKR